MRLFHSGLAAIAAVLTTATALIPSAIAQTDSAPQSIIDRCVAAAEETGLRLTGVGETFGGKMAATVMIRALNSIDEPLTIECSYDYSAKNLSLRYLFDKDDKNKSEGTSKNRRD